MKFEAGDLVGFPVRMEFKEDVFTQAVSIIDLMVKLDTSLLVKLTAWLNLLQSVSLQFLFFLLLQDCLEHFYPANQFSHN